MLVFYYFITITKLIKSSDHLILIIYVIFIFNYIYII